MSVCGSEIRESRAKAVQPGNREWVTAIIHNGILIYQKTTGSV
jgi:hypothetical protein